jgi:hypothetical protein
MTPESRNNEVRIDFYLLGNDTVNTFQPQRIANNNRVTSVAMQRRYKHAFATIQYGVFRKVRAQWL